MLRSIFLKKRKGKEFNFWSQVGPIFEETSVSPNLRNFHQLDKLGTSN